MLGCKMKIVWGLYQLIDRISAIGLIICCLTSKDMQIIHEYSRRGQLKFENTKKGNQKQQTNNTMATNIQKYYTEN